VYYTGVTNNLRNRLDDHINKVGSIFASKYNCTDLIHYEVFDDIEEAIKREKQIKNWKRAWKEDLVQKYNPNLEDLTKSALVYYCPY
jgi:putative endonuclease